MCDEPKKWTRITLTKSAKDTAVGRELIAILAELLRDGRLDDSEIVRLKTWSDDARFLQTAFPAIIAIRDIVQSILVDGNVSPEERADLVDLLLRVLPADERAPLKDGIQAARDKDEADERSRRAQMRLANEAAREAEQAERERLRALRQAERKAERETRAQAWRDDPATDAQLNYLRALGASFGPWISKGEASNLIDAMLNSRSGVSNRQMMVLRFWNRMDIADGGKNAVCEWMDTWYALDPDHVAAWELWKEAHGDCGRQISPEIVPLGAGIIWLEKIKGRELNGRIRQIFDEESAAMLISCMPIGGAESRESLNSQRALLRSYGVEDDTFLRMLTEQQAEFLIRRFEIARGN